MYRQALRSTSFKTRVLFSLLVVLMVGIIVTFLGILIGTLFFGSAILNAQNLTTDLTNQSNVSIMKYIQCVQTVGVFIFPPLLIAWFLSDNPIEYLKLRTKTTLRAVSVVIVMIYAANPLINLLNELNSYLTLPSWLSGLEEWMRSAEASASQITDAFLKGSDGRELIANIAMIAVLPALGEEFLFRGIIQTLIKEKTKNAHVAIWISATLFSAMHLQFFGFLPRLFLGALFGYLLEWSGSLWLPITAHFINNASAVLFYYLIEHNHLEFDPDKVGTFQNGTPYIAAVSLAILVALCTILIKYDHQHRLANMDEDEK